MTDDLFRADAYLRSCDARIVRIDDTGIVLDRTVFYPLGGGQAGDSGVLAMAGGREIVIADTRKAKDAEGKPTDEFIHVPAPGQDELLAALKPGDAVAARIDWERRHRLMRFHTASHLLCHLVPVPVNGCSITPDYARIDFHMTDPLDKDALTAGLARLVEAAHPLTVGPSTWSSVWLRGVFGDLPAAGLRAEIAAQLDRFEDHLGRNPDFIDGHQHVHQFLQVRDALFDVLVKRYPYRRPWLRSTRAAAWAFKPRLLERLGARALLADADLLDFPHNGRLLGVYDFRGGPVRYAALMADWLNAARHGDLLMCHPSTQAISGDEISQARLDEYELLSSARFGELVAAAAVRLDAMSRLLRDERFAAAGAMR